MHRLVTAVLLASLAPAQPSVDLVCPTDAVVLQVDGPEALRLAFLPTSVGSLLAAREARDFWSLLASPLLKRAGELTHVDPAPALEALRGYRGRITVAIGRGVGDAGRIDGVVILAPDGETDLAALRDRLTLPDPVVGGVSVGAPVLIDGHLVVFFGPPGDGEVAQRRRAAGGFAADAAFSKSPIAVRLNLAVLLSGEGASWVGDEKLAELLGFRSLDELRVLVRPSGPRVEVELSVAFGRDQRGIFAGLLPASAKPPSLVGLVPPDHPDWVAGKLDAGVFVGELLDAVDAWAPGLVDGDEWVTLREATAAMSGDYAKVGSLLGPDGEAGEFCMAFELRDPQAFDAAFWSLLGEDAGDHEKAIAAGEVVTSRQDFLCEIVFARWRNLVFVHGGDRGAVWFSEMLQRGRSANAGNKVVLPKAIEQLRRAFGPGYQGCARIDIRDLVHALPGLRLVWPLQAEYEQQLGLVRDLLGQLAPLLEKYDCESAYALSGWQGCRWRACVFW